MSDEVAPLRPVAMTYRRFFERELAGLRQWPTPVDGVGLPDQPGTRKTATLLVSSLAKKRWNWHRYGADIETWRWASEHVAISRNSVCGLPLIGNRASIQRAIGGQS